MGTESGSWRRVGVLAVVLLVAAVLPVPGGRHPGFGRVGPDKVLHAVGYGAFAVALADALDDGRGDAAGTAGLAVAGSAVYGLVVGRLQRQVPSRRDERADHVAGIVGAVLAVAAWAARTGDE